MKLEEINPSPQIQKVTLYVYEGELEYDEEGNITNKLRETLTYERPNAEGAASSPAELP